MAAHEETWTEGRDALDRAPVAHVDDADDPLLQVRTAHHAAALVIPGDAGTQVRHARYVEFGDRPAHIEIHHPAMAVARRTHHVGVVLAEVEVVEGRVEPRAAHIEIARSRDALAHLVVVHIALVDRLGIFVVRDFPDFGQILQRCDEGLARRRVIHRRYPRAQRAGSVGDVEELDQPEFGVEQHQRLRQVVGDRDEAPVGRHRGVAGIDAGAHLGHGLEVPEIVLGDPAVARCEIDEAAVRRELRPAVQRETRRKAVDARHAVAVEDADVVIPTLDHDEQVHRIGVEYRLCRQAARRAVLDPRCADVQFAPARRRIHRRVDPVRQGVDVGRGQHLAEGRHPGRRAPGADGRGGIGAFQPCQVLGQQGGPAAADAIAAVAGGAMGLVEGFGVGSGDRQRCQRQHPCKQQRPHGCTALTGTTRRHGVTATRARPSAMPISASSR